MSRFSLPAFLRRNAVACIASATDVCGNVSPVDIFPELLSALVVPCIPIFLLDVSRSDLCVFCTLIALLLLF